MTFLSSKKAYITIADKPSWSPYATSMPDAIRKRVMEQRVGHGIRSSEGETYPDEIFDQQYVAEWLKVSPKCLEAWRLKGYGPKFLRIGRLVRYRCRDVLAYLDAQVRRSTSDNEQEAVSEVRKCR